MILVFTSAKGNSWQLSLQIQVQGIWRLWPQDEREGL